eukprot:g10172.t1
MSTDSRPCLCCACTSFSTVSFPRNRCSCGHLKKNHRAQEAGHRSHQSWSLTHSGQDTHGEHKNSGSWSSMVMKTVRSGSNAGMETEKPRSNRSSPNTTAAATRTNSHHHHGRSNSTKSHQNSFSEENGAPHVLSHLESLEHINEGLDGSVSRHAQGRNGKGGQGWKPGRDLQEFAEVLSEGKLFVDVDDDLQNFGALLSSGKRLEVPDTPLNKGNRKERFAVVMLGPPGSGKGTISRLMVENFNYFHLSTGDMLREHIRNGTALGKQAEYYTKQGKLVPDDLVMGMVKQELITRPKGAIVFDGCPLTRKQAEELDEIIDIDVALHISVPFSTILSRCHNRWTHAPTGRVYSTDFHPPKVKGKDDITGEPLVQKPEDSEEALQRKLDIYVETTLPLLNYYKEKKVLASYNGNTHEELIKVGKLSQAIYKEIEPKLMKVHRTRRDKEDFAELLESGQTKTEHDLKEFADVLVSGKKFDSSFEASRISARVGKFAAVIVGPPGGGKGTISSMLMRDFGLNLISSHLIAQSHLISAHHSSSHLISSHLISSHLIAQSQLISSHLISSQLISSHLLNLSSSHLISAHLISSHLISSHLIAQSQLMSAHLISSHLISSHLISSHLIAQSQLISHLTSSHLSSLISPHLISSLISPHLISQLSSLISPHLISHLSSLISPHLSSLTSLISHLSSLISAQPEQRKQNIKQFLHVSTGDLLRQQIQDKTQLGLMAHSQMQNGSFVSDSLVVSLVRSHLESREWNAVLFDGFPRNLEQAEALHQILPVDLVIHLAVPFDDILKRNEKRMTHIASGRVYSDDYNAPKVKGIDDVTGERLVHREDDNLETIKVRLDKYLSQTTPLIKYYRDRKLLVSFSGQDEAQLLKQDKRSEAIYKKLHPLMDHALKLIKPPQAKS